MKLPACVFNDAVYTELNTEVKSEGNVGTLHKRQASHIIVCSNQRHPEYKAPRRDV